MRRTPSSGPSAAAIPCTIRKKGFRFASSAFHPAFRRRSWIRISTRWRSTRNSIASYHYSAELNYWEYAGSFRYSLSASRFQPFLKAGYGWSWYRLENVQANGERFTPADSDWIGPKHIWPNVWHFGLGIEFIPWKRSGKLPGGADIAFRFEYARYLQNLGLDLSTIPLNKLEIFFPTLGDVPVGTRVSRDDFVFGVTVSF